MHVYTEAERLADLGQFLASDPIRRVQTGASSHVIIHRQGKSAVRYFPPAHPAGQVRRPLFISMPLINTWTVFDLLPGMSVIEKLVAHGVPVYLLDWGRPGPEDVEVTLGELVDDLLPRALRRSARHARQHGHLAADELPDALGYCVGGSFLSISLARNPGLARRMALLAAPIDFHASGRLSSWADKEGFPVDDIVDGFGNFPKAMMKDAFAWLRPMGQLSKWKTIYDKIDHEGFPTTWAAMEQWNGDGVDFPGEAYRAYIKGCYFENALVGGGWVLDGRPVDLKQGTIPAHAFAAKADHICPPAAAFGLSTAWGGPVSTEVVSGGHVGVCIGKSFPARLLAWIDA
ncbi:MAG: hypothetical protein RL071_1135 [Pseudomonadota bacterium]